MPMISRIRHLLHTLAAKRTQCVLILPTLLVFSAQGCTDNSGQSTIPQIGVRNGHAMAYDSGREYAMLFGGADASMVRGDTWEWDGNGWTPLSAAGPEPRTFPAMTYDSLRQKVVLFGGNRVLFGKGPHENTFLNDTWEWDGHRWTRIEAAGPSPRAEAAIAFDSRRGRVVLFGGYNHTGEAMNRLGDTWEWDGSAWTEIKVTGSSPRSGAAQVYDSVRGKIVLFGGATQAGVSGETWEWDGKQWVENRAALTEGRFNCVMAYDDARQKVIRFGGRYAGKPMGDTWEYDGEGWNQLSATGPTARNHAAMVYDSKRQKMVLFGGHDFGLHDDGVNVFGDTWEWNENGWVQKQAGEPEKRIDNGH